MQKILLCLLFASFVGAAPSPQPKPFRNLCINDLIGKWNYRSSGLHGTFEFRDNGTFTLSLEGVDKKDEGSWILENNEIKTSIYSEEARQCRYILPKIRDKTKIHSMEFECHYHYTEYAYRGTNIYLTKNKLEN